MWCYIGRNSEFKKKNDTDTLSISKFNIQEYRTYSYLIFTTHKKAMLLVLVAKKFDNYKIGRV
jgi:hypothetical protein